MKIECVREFGNFKPGDQIDVPAGSVFDQVYFKLVLPAENGDE